MSTFNERSLSYCQANDNLEIQEEEEEKDSTSK
jgi:hypothetical protein